MPVTTPGTLGDIRAWVLDLTQPFPLAAITMSAAGTTTTYIDQVHLVDPLLGGVYVGGWLLRTAPTLNEGSRERRIVAHDTTNGQLTLSPALFAAPTPPDGYEVWSIDRPTYAERLINRALARVRAPIDTPITTVAGTRQYDLSAQAWLVRPSQVLGVVARRGTVPATDDAAVEGWRIYQDGATLWLDLRDARVADGSALVLRALAGGDGPLSWSADSTTTAPAELVAYEAAYDLLRRPPQGVDTSPDLAGQRQARAHDLRRTLLAVRETYRSTVPVPLFAEGERWGITGAGHAPGARWG